MHQQYRQGRQFFKAPKSFFSDHRNSSQPSKTYWNFFRGGRLQEGRFLNCSTAALHFPKQLKNVS